MNSSPSSGIRESNEDDRRFGRAAMRNRSKGARRKNAGRHPVHSPRMPNRGALAGREALCPHPAREHTRNAARSFRPGRAHESPIVRCF